MTDKQLIREWYKDPAMVGKPIWVRDNDKDEWNIGIFVNYADEEEQPFQCKYSNWLYAKPVKPEDLYQAEFRKLQDEPKIERRWRYAKDKDECTITTSNYVTDNLAKDYGYLEEGWYKLENDYIDVEVEA